MKQTVDRDLRESMMKYTQRNLVQIEESLRMVNLDVLVIVLIIPERINVSAKQEEDI